MLSNMLHMGSKKMQRHSGKHGQKGVGSNLIHGSASVVHAWSRYIAPNASSLNNFCVSRL